MTIVELCSLLRRKIVMVLAFTVAGCLAGVGFGFVALEGTYTSTTSVYVDLTQNVPVVSEDGSVVERYQQFSSNEMTNMVTDVATLAGSKQVVSDAANEARVSNPKDFTVAPTVEKTSHVITLTVTGPNEDVQKIADQLPRSLQQRTSEILDIDSVRKISDASGPEALGTTKKHILYSCVGLFAGLFVAVLVVLLQDTMKPRIKGKREIEDYFDLPVLGNVSDAAAVSWLRAAILKRCKESDGSYIGIAATSGESVESVILKLEADKNPEGVEFIELPSLMDSPESIEKACKVKGVALAVCPYATLEKDIATIIDRLRLAGVNTLGFIVVD